MLQSDHEYLPDIGEMFMYACVISVEINVFLWAKNAEMLREIIYMYVYNIISLFTLNREHIGQCLVLYFFMEVFLYLSMNVKTLYSGLSSV